MQNWEKLLIIIGINLIAILIIFKVIDFVDNKIKKQLHLSLLLSIHGNVINKISIEQNQQLK